jgi:hypothetical protein
MLDIPLFFIALADEGQPEHAGSSVKNNRAEPNDDNSLLPNAPLAEYDWPGFRMARVQSETIHPFLDGNGRLAKVGTACEGDEP